MSLSLDNVSDLMLAVVGGVLRVGTPFLFVSLGECLTEKSGRINLRAGGRAGLQRHGGIWRGGLPDGLAWLGVLAACFCGALLAMLHGLLCSLPRVSDIATGIALMLLGAGLAFYLGKPSDSAASAADPVAAAGRLEQLAGRCRRRSSTRSSPSACCWRPAGLGLQEHALGPRGAHGR